MFKNKKLFSISLLILLILFGIFSQNQAVQASDSIFPGPNISNQCVEQGRCTLCEMIQTVVNVGLFLLGIAGAIVLLFFVYGGFMMLISGGNPDRINKGKSILVNSTIGIAIAFLAYATISFIISSVTQQGPGFNWSSNLQCAPLPAEQNYQQRQYPGVSSPAASPGSP